jgi:glycosyltransferase involved in cell wall biosynthesis
VEATLHSLGVRNVSIHDSIPKDQTRGCYHSFDVCLVPLAPIPAFESTIPSKIFEIMACERPVLASVNGEARAIVEKSGCGIAVPPGNSEAIAHAVRQIRALTPDMRRQMGARGRQYVRQHYSRDTLARRYYERLLLVAGRPHHDTVPSHNPDVAAD